MDRPLAAAAAAAAAPEVGEDAASFSFSLPSSPRRSPSGSENMSVWVEDAGGEQRVHVALNSEHPRACAGSADVSPPPPAPDAARATNLSADVSVPPPPPPQDVMDFPLILCDSGAQGESSSAIVPFQKLQLDTNLNQTLLPYRSAESSASRSSFQSAGGPPDSPAARMKAQQLASSFLALDPDASAATMMSSGFMTALRDLGERRGVTDEPQLSVRLRGNRIELASASEDEQVDFLGPAENIKQLFKLPYSRSGVSLAVHRVGSTLVVDGELSPSELPAGFENATEETVRIEQQSLASSEDEVVDEQQSLLYEKFIYESAIRARLPPAETKSDAAGIREESEEEDQSPEPQLQSPLQPRQQQQQQQESPQQLSRSARVKTRSPKSTKKSDKSLVSVGADGSSRAEVIKSPRRHPGDSDEHASSALRHVFQRFPSEQEDGEKAGAQAFADAMKPARARTFQASGHESAASAAARSPPASYDFPTFQRVLKWKFHDLKMILGSQVLLFSNPDHPAVSLRLHDMDQELSLCTVLDYYLDNVIANIPELAICMHSKGIVRGYKLVETRHIPYMSDTGRPLFDVQDVSMNASMLLKFLQENCSRPNGTYWLYRKEGESSLRLYDVNVLSQGKQLKWKYMMAMLCYRFAVRASRLTHSLASGSPRLQKQLQQRQRDLLGTCMNLLGEIAQAGGASHSSICASVSEQLADTYIRECEQLHGVDRKSASLADEEAADENQHAVETLEHAKEHLSDSIMSFKECVPPKESPSALAHEKDDEGRDAIHGSDAGTDGTDAEDGDNDDGMAFFMDEELTRLKLKFSSVCLEQGVAYSKSRKWPEAVESMLEACQFLPLGAIPDLKKPWAERSAASEKDSASSADPIDELLDELDFDGVAGRLSMPGRMPICSSFADLRCFLLERIGDAASQLPVSVTNHLTGLYRILSGEEREALQEVQDNAKRSRWLQQAADGERPLFQSLSDAADSVESLLMLAFLSYLRSMSPPVDSELYFLLMKKLGNASNELGKYFSGRRQDYPAAFMWFQRGARIFSDIEDGINVALLYANMSHLHKILARGKDQAARETHYRTAIQLCSDALQRLKQTKAELELRNKVKGELALTYLVWAVDMAACDPGADQVRDKAAAKAQENEVLRTFDRALILYNELGDAKQAAAAHYQIASFYNRSIARDLQAGYKSSSASTGSSEPLSTSSALKNRMEIARRHYEKALDYFGKAEVGQTFILIHQELADLYAMGGRVEDIEHALLFLLNTYEAFSRASAASKAGEDSMAMLACDVIAKVKALLHELIRRCAAIGGAATGSSHTKGRKLDMFKRMYKEVIYYDGYSAGGSVVPIMGTLRAMYSL